MKLIIIVGVGLGLILASVIVTLASANNHAELAKVRKANDKFRRVEVARRAGYDLREGLDHCFENPSVGGMGFHYINTDILDLKLDALQPEAMVYPPGPKGKLSLGAVEYIVPAADWDAAGNTKPPSVLGRHLHLNEELGVYVLHIWLWRHNPAGIFEDWNPTVSCSRAGNKY
jgi:hypothetical protein